MKIMHCPMNGPRNISEFVYGGEVKNMPSHRECTDKEWAEYVFYSENSAGIVKEWWFHAPSAYWFIAVRHTVTDDIIRTFDPQIIYDKRVDFNSEEGAQKQQEANQ